MRAIARGTRTAMRAVWGWLRQVSGDAAYEDYVRSAAQRLKRGAGNASSGLGRGASIAAQVLSPEEFYVETLKRRYSGVSRCC